MPTLECFFTDQSVEPSDDDLRATAAVSIETDQSVQPSADDPRAAATTGIDSGVESLGTKPFYGNSKRKLDVSLGSECQSTEGSG